MSQSTSTSKKLKTDGEYEVYVTDAGWFEAHKDNEVQYTSTTLAGLEERINKARKSARIVINVPFVYVDGAGVVADGFVYGKHARTGQWLASQNGKKGAQSIYSDVGYIKSLTPEEREELKKLSAALQAASLAYHEFVRSRRYEGFTRALKDAWLKAGGE